MNRDLIKRTINSAMARNDIVPQDIERSKIMSANTFYQRRRKPELFRLDELLKMDKLIGFTDDELLTIMGRE